ncbi:MAG: extracellular solute-binding protein [Thermomicrobiales bacterium]|nr:extracellular solute-binding protein [Thermomicrobiales bacterium]MCO5221756.1 extracellular solute-binding protein [Thermomicrobiales bacterium]
MKATAAAMAAGLPLSSALRIEAMAQESSPTANIAGTSLKILQWSHFVPSYDTWFDAFAQAWGEANDVEVTVDHINTAEVPTTIAAELSAGEGHDLVEHISSLAQYEKSMLPMNDLLAEASARHGEQLGMCAANSYNPTTDTYYGFVHGYAPDPGNYRKGLWETVELPDGPSTWDELLSGGTRIRSEQGVQLGIGMSNEIDSRMAAQTLIWAFGGAIQDENENVTVNSPEVIEAVAYMADLFKNTMTEEVFGWTAASNNQLLIAGQASYILNSISAFRTAQEAQPDVAADVFFKEPLVGPAGAERALAHGHAVFNYQIPNYSPNSATAQEFILHLVENYYDACVESKYYNFPAWPDLTPELLVDGGWLDVDQFGADPPDKLAPMKTANDWTVNLGWPGPANAAIGEVFNLPTIPNMMARAATGLATPEESVAQAEEEINAIFETWRGEGLIGGGS